MHGDLFLALFFTVFYLYFDDIYPKEPNVHYFFKLARIYKRSCCQRVTSLSFQRFVSLIYLNGIFW